MAKKKQTNANFQLEVAGLNANLFIDQNTVGCYCNINVQYQLDRKTGAIKFAGDKEPDFAKIKTAIETELKAVNMEYTELIPVPTPAG